MNRRFDSEHESGSTRTAFEALRASRPRTPAELTSVDTEDAAEMFWRIVGDVESQPRRHRFRRRHFTLAVSAAAAAAVIGVLVALPDRGSTPVSVGEGATTAPADTAPEPTPVATEVVDASAMWPEIAPAPAVGALMTARANMIVNDQYRQTTLGPEVFTMADGDVNVGSPVGQAEDGTMQMVDNRYAGGEWYFNHLDQDGEGMQWSYDPNDEPIFVGVSPSDPRDLYDRLAPSAGFEADGTDFVLGVETVHLVATTPGAIDPLLVQYQPYKPDSVVSLELWVDSNGIVRRIDVTYIERGFEEAAPPGDDASATEPLSTEVDPAGSTVPSMEATVSIEFYDIGEPITIDVPRDAVEIDDVG